MKAKIRRKRLASFIVISSRNLTKIKPKEESTKTLVTNKKKKVCQSNSRRHKEPPSISSSYVKLPSTSSQKLSLQRLSVPKRRSLAKAHADGDSLQNSQPAKTVMNESRCTFASPTNERKNSSSQYKEEQQHNFTPIVEVYNKNEACFSSDNKRKTKDKENNNEQKQRNAINHLLDTKKENPYARKHKPRNYEMSTVSSRIKQIHRRRYCENTNEINIPFVASQSTAPSHSLGINLNQIWAGMKVQQPASGIPMTLAHRMGLGYVMSKTTNSDTELISSLSNREINSIRLGRRLFMWPAFKSCNGLLNVYRQNDGIVARFLRSISRQPHFTDTEEPACEDAVRRNVHVDQDTEVHENMDEYGRYFREYWNLNEMVRNGNSDENLRRRQYELNEPTAWKRLNRQSTAQVKSRELML